MTVKKLLYTFSILLLIYGYSQAQEEQLKPYIKVLNEKGKEPALFVLDKLEHYDLLIFDDALHTAVEPFDFYQELIMNTEFQKEVRYIFLEAVSVNQQTALDAYFNSAKNDISLLYPAFQNDFSGTGWRYKIYFDLLNTIWETNRQLPDEQQFKVVAVNAPTYWCEISTPEDVELFRLSLSGNDYTMYKIILSYLDNFKSGEKGIFLTNTRHAYKQIKNSKGENYLNCGTFFYLHNPGKTYSVRFHNINLFFEGVKNIDENTPKTTEGLEDVIVKWVRMEKGLWDSAFEEYGNKPVAFDLKDTPFGEAEYIGNHMLNAAPNQTMYGAYDALIFLAPVDEMRQTAMVNFIYTEEFKKELERRSEALYTKEQLNEILSNYGFNSVSDFIEGYFQPELEKLQPLVDKVGPIDEWKEEQTSMY